MISNFRIFFEYFGLLGLKKTVIERAQDRRVVPRVRPQFLRIFSVDFAKSITGKCHKKYEELKRHLMA